MRRVRLWRGLTQQQLADLAGWTRTAVTMLETGARGLDSRVRLRQLAEVLRVAPTDLTGEPYPLDAPGLAEAQANVPALEIALMDAGIGDEADYEPRSLEELDQAVNGPLLAARRAADDAACLALLPDLITELQAHGRHERALQLLVTATVVARKSLRNVGQVALAWIAGQRSVEAAALHADPVLIGAAEFSRAHARPSVSRGLPRITHAADALRPVESDRLAQEVYGMLRLTAAFAAQLRGDHAGASAQVQEAARVAEVHGELPGSWGSFGPANVRAWRTSMAVEAGEPDQALHHAATVQMDALDSNGRRAAFLLDMARAHHLMGRGHDRQTVVAVRQAEKLAPVKLRASPWARDLVEVMLTQSRREAGGRELRGLAFRMGLDA